MDLQSYIGIYKKIVPEETCKNLVQDSSNFAWRKFEWTSQSQQKITYSNEYSDQVDTCEKLIPKYKFLLNPIIENCVNDYKIRNAPELNNIMGISEIKLNKYQEGSSLRKHVDHIHSLFDGHRKGIPTFSIVGLLNDDFEGGNFIFWDDHIIPFETGTIIIFPSNFLYPHRVDTILKGTRHSFVSWVW